MTIDGWTLGDDGYWTGPDGERLKVISGAQDYPFDPGGLSEFPTVGGGDMAGYYGSSWAPMSSVPGGGGGSWLDTLSGYANQAMPFLRLGTQGLGAFAGIEGMMQAGRQNKYMQQAQKTAQQAAAPALAAQQALLPAGTSAMLGGALPPGLEAQVNQWANGAKAQARQYYAHAGIQDSTMMAEMDAYIDQLAQGMRAQYAQGLLTGGFQAGQGAVSAAGLGGQLAGLGEGAANQAVQQANQALYRVLGMA